MTVLRETLPAYGAGKRFLARVCPHVSVLVPLAAIGGKRAILTPVDHEFNPDPVRIRLKQLILY